MIQKMSYSKNEKQICIICGLILGFASLIGYSMNLYSEYNPSTGIISHVISSLHCNSINSLLIYCAMTFLMYHVAHIAIHHLVDKVHIVLSICIGVFFAINIPIGRSYRYNNSLSLFWGNGAQIIKSITIIIGWSVFLTGISVLVFYGLSYLFCNDDTCSFLDCQNRIVTFLREKKYAIFILSLIRYFPVLFIYYPGILMGDTGYQIPEAFGVKIPWSGLQRVYTDTNYTNMHPITHTMLYKVFMSLGKCLFNSYRAGLYMMLLFQAVLLVFIVSRILSFFLQTSKKPTLVLLSLLLFWINPIITNFMLLATKDVFYTSFLCLFVFELYLCINEHKQKKIWILCLAMIGTLLFRGEGFYIVIFTLISVLIYRIKSKGIKSSRGIVALIFIYAGFFMILNSLILPFFHIEKQAKNQHMSFPMQQMSRYVYEDYPFTDAEKLVIDKIVDYDSIKTLYNPNVADSVKDAYKLDASEEDQKQFIKLWMHTVIRRPGTAISAFVNNKYEFFLIDESYMGLYSIEWSQSRMLDINSWCRSVGVDTELSYPDCLKGIRERFYTYSVVIVRIPVFSILLNPAIYVISMIYLLAFILLNKEYKKLLYMIPMLLVFVIPNLFGSMNGTYSRYMYPIIVLMSFMLLMFE